jgi:hypothetical protein
MLAKRFTLFSCLIILTLLLSAGVMISKPALAGLQAAEKSPDGIPEPLILFNGLRRDQADPSLGGDSQVPDTSGDVGITRYIQAVNTSVAMYDKGGHLIDSAKFDDLWEDAGTDTLCDGNPANPHHHGQPNVLYDHMAQRWFIMDLAYTNIDDGPYYLCMAVSDFDSGEAPDDLTHNNWLYYALPSQNQAPYFMPDQARVGLWPDGYYIAADLYDIENNGTNRTTRGVKVWAVNRDDLVNHTVPFRSKAFHMTEDYGYWGLLPSNLRGDPPPTGTPNYFVAIAPPNLFYIWQFSMDWLDMDASTFPFAPTVLNMANNFDWTVGYQVVQYGSTEQLDIHGDRLSSVQYRLIDGQDTLWASHTVMDQSGVDDLRWYEIRDLTVAPYFYQEGSYAPDVHYRWVSSIGVDVEGNMALGYSLSAPTVEIYPSVFYTGRLVSDPLNTLPLGERALIYGGGYQNMNPTTDEGPWGEHSAMSIDPVDPCIFWYTNQYYIAGYPTVWRTIIGAFRYPTCQMGTTARVSLSTADVQGNGASGVDYEAYSVSISGDGRFVAFSSEATNLVAGDTNNRRDVFVRDRDTDQDGVFDEPGAVSTVCVSVGVGGVQSNGDSYEVSISGDGRYVAYASDASNLVSGDTNGTRDVFRYDTATAQTIRVSVSSAQIQGNGVSDQPSISYYGGYVAFRSYANNLVFGDVNDPSDIFVRDIGTNSTALVSVDSDGVQGNNESYSPAISGDARFVAFVSEANNLVSNDTNGVSDIFVHDRLYGPTVMASVRDGTGTPGNGESYEPAISYFGAYVAFVSRATNLDPRLSDTNGAADVFMRNIASETTKMVSLSYFHQQGNADSYTPSISGEGLYVAFASDASTLDVYEDLNGQRDIFLHDNMTGLTRRITWGYNGLAANNRSVAPVISFYGRHVAFPSRASNLVVDDTNNQWDVFVHDNLGDVPTFLSVPGNVPAMPGEAVDVPVYFTGFGRGVDASTFSIDFDETCLTYSSSTFNLPGTSTGGVSYDPNDTNGELDYVIYPTVNPSVPLPDSTIVTIHFSVMPSCQAGDGPRSARVGFSTDPRASFAINGQSVRGSTADGLVTVMEGYLGDCNGSLGVDAGDLGALVYEIFDGDGNVPADTPKGTYNGSAVGCNPNQDLVVDAADISCAVMIIFGDYTCTGGGGTLGADGGQINAENATLSLPLDAPGPARTQVTLPVDLTTHGSAVNSLVFSVNYDASWLTFDPTDADGDGLPDAIGLNLPEGFQASVSEGTSGKLDFVVYASTPGLTLSDGTLATITLKTGSPAETTLAPVDFYYDPPVSIGSTGGRSLPVTANSGSIWVYWWNTRIFLPFTVLAP